MENLFIRKGVKKEDGSTIILALLVTILFVILSGGYFGLLSVEANNTARTFRSNLALHLAESGVEESIWEIKYNGGAFASSDGWSGTNPVTRTETFQTAAGESVGDYVMTVTNSGTSHVTIESTAYVPSQASPYAQRTVKVELENAVESDFSMAAYGVDSLTLGQNARADSFDSRDAAYDPDDPGSNGDIGTSSISGGAISLGSGAYIDGDGFVGVSGDPNTVMPSNSLSGVKTAQTTAYAPPIVTVPTGLTPQGDLHLLGGTQTISASAQYGDITLEKNSVIIIDHDVELYLTGDLYFKKNTTVKINDGASLKIYMDGGIKMNKDGTFNFNNVSQDPTKLMIYGTGSYDNSNTNTDDDGNTVQGILIKKETTFYGVICAPNASITINKDSQIYGAIVGKNINIKQNTKVHFDEALLNSGAGSNSSYSIVYWQEK